MTRQRSSPIAVAAIRKLLDGVVTGLGLEMTERKREQLATHFALLLKWNEKINLTSIREPKEIATRHFEESLFLAKLMSPPPGLLVDIGSGAGFPGLPLKIAWPEVETVLLEPNQKRATFLKEVVRTCGLEGIQVRAERLESTVRSEFAGRAGLATMRAVAPAAKALGDAVGLLAPAGKLALFLGTEASNQLPPLQEIRWLRQEAIPHSLRRVILLGERFTN